MIIDNDDVIEIQFTKREKNKLNKHEYNSPNYTGLKSELITKHILQNKGHDVIDIDGRLNIYKGDLYVVDMDRFIEVKTGTLFNGRYKMCCDYKYTKKDGTNYVQKKGLKEPWLLHTGYDCMCIVFDTFIVLLPDYEMFLNYVLGSIALRFFIDDGQRFDTRQDLLDAWSNKKYEFYLGINITGSIKNSNNIYDTHLCNINLIPFCINYNIPCQVIHYKVI